MQEGVDLPASPRGLQRPSQSGCRLSVWPVEFPLLLQGVCTACLPVQNPLLTTGCSGSAVASAQASRPRRALRAVAAVEGASSASRPPGGLSPSSLCWRSLCFPFPALTRAVYEHSSSLSGSTEMSHETLAFLFQTSVPIL